MTTREQAIIDAAVEVAAFATTRPWPEEHTVAFDEFTLLMDKLATSIRSLYPSFPRGPRS